MEFQTIPLDDLHEQNKATEKETRSPAQTVQMEAQEYGH